VSKGNAENAKGRRRTHAPLHFRELAQIKPPADSLEPPKAHAQSTRRHFSGHGIDADYRAGRKLYPGFSDYSLQHCAHRLRLLVQMSSGLRATSLELSDVVIDATERFGRRAAPSRQNTRLRQPVAIELGNHGL
jgi:hypothetical protein